MANGNVELDSREIQQLERVFGITAPRELKKSMRRALSRTRTGARQKTADHVRETFNILAGRLKKDVVLTRPNYSAMAFSVIGRKRTIGLLNFRGKGGPARQTQAGVSVAVKHGERKLIRHAFIATGLGGHRHIFTRYSRTGTPLPYHRPAVGRYQGDRRQKLRALKGPSVADMMNTTEVYEPLADEAQQRFLNELSRNLRFFLGR